MNDEKITKSTVIDSYATYIFFSLIKHKEGFNAFEISAQAKTNAFMTSTLYFDNISRKDLYKLSDMLKELAESV